MCHLKVKSGWLLVRPSLLSGKKPWVEKNWQKMRHNIWQCVCAALRAIWHGLDISAWIWFSCSSVLISQRNHSSMFDHVWSFNYRRIHHNPYRNYTSQVACVISSVLLPDVYLHLSGELACWHQRTLSRQHPVIHCSITTATWADGPSFHLEKTRRFMTPAISVPWWYLYHQ
jgi:hypothetical protein